MEAFGSILLLWLNRHHFELAFFVLKDFKHNLIAFFLSVWMLRVHQQRAKALVAFHARDADPQTFRVLALVFVVESYAKVIGMLAAAESVESLEASCLFFFFALCVIYFSNNASCTVYNIRVDFNPFHRTELAVIEVR